MINAGALPHSPAMARSLSQTSQCRILYVTGQLGTGGAERQLVYLLSGIDRQRYCPAVVVWHYSDRDLHVQSILRMGVPLFPIDGAASRFSKLRMLRALVKTLQPQVIHSYSFHTNVAAWYAARGISAVAVGSIRNDFVLDKALTGPLLAMSSSLLPAHHICNSAAAAANIRRARGIAVPRQLTVIRNGLDLNQYTPASPPAGAMPCIVGVGSLVPWKRWDRLIAAAHTLKQRKLDCLIRIAGSGPLRAALEDQARRLGVSDRLEFLGESADVPSLLAQASFLVHPSDNEGCPNAVMEAMACGRAVVATDAGDVPQLIEDGETGFVVQRGDDAMLVDRIRRLLEDPDVCRRMGEAGRAKAEKDFSIDRLVALTLEAYRTAGWTGS